MAESKRCIVFATKKRNEDGFNLYDYVQFYAFDEAFIPVENEQEVSLDKTSEWIKIKDPSLIARPVSGLDHCHIFSSYASLGCRVFRAGGNYFACGQCNTLAHRLPPSKEVDYYAHTVSRSVDCWDAINNCWTSLPPMNVGRHMLHLHILQGKLFAVGGYKSSDELRFIEMFDESKGGWIPFPYPPDIVKIDTKTFMSAAVEHKGFIFFGSLAYNSFYAFTPPDSWVCMDHLPFDNGRLISQCQQSPAVVVGNHLLWLDGNTGSTLIGFDVERGNYFEINLASEGLLPGSGISAFRPQLLHVGNGVLALVWSDCCLYVLEGKSKGKGEVKDQEQYNWREASGGGFHCYRFSIDFDRAYAREKCCELISRQRCIGPRVMHMLGAAFVADVGVAVGNIGCILSGRKRRRSKRLTWRSVRPHQWA